MRLSKLVSGINVLGSRGSLDTEIVGITYDSREVSDGSLFLAQGGVHTDGHDHIDEALSRGAAAVIHSRELSTYLPGIAYIRVENPRVVLSPIAAAFYGHPSSELTTVGVTGTNGKSTTAFFIYQLLNMLNLRSGLLSTVAVDTDGELVKNPSRKSTADASEVQAALRAMVESTRAYAVVEATSHGLSSENNRLGDILFSAAVFTNITHEHLNFHGTFERYLDAKANLFRYLDKVPNAFGVVNQADEHALYMRKATHSPVYSFGMEAEADMSATAIKPEGGGYRFTIDCQSGSYETALSLPGDFNIENALAAALTVEHLIDGVDMGAIAQILPSLEAPVGRMKRVGDSDDVSVYVDYAHSPDSFMKILPLFRQTTQGRLICVFGSAGEGDVEKRPEQGRIASEFCDVIVLADEDPRGEDSMSILQDIASGCASKTHGETLFLIPDRKDAIFHAVQSARPGDTVLLLGKGHESSIVLSSGPVPWNEEQVALEALKGR